MNNDITQSNFGTGIGLHLSRSLVELHRGTITAENRTESAGTRLIIRLPLGCDHLRQEELEDPTENTVFLQEPVCTESTTPLFSQEESREESVKTKTNFQVVIAEDNEEIRKYLLRELIADVKVIECTNGKEAWDYLLKEQADLVITDVMMPGLDGITLCRRIKQNSNLNHIPVILLTVRTQQEDKIEGLKTGADAYLIKPFNTEVLRTTIFNLISNRQRLKSRYTVDKKVEEKIDKIEKKSNNEMLMEKILKTINEHLADPELNVEMLAANVGMSRVHMHRKLKELTNQSARDFIRSIRLRQAATLLREGHLSISEVAYATGFVNLSYFSNSFKEFYGVSPTEYKEQKM